MKSTSKAKGSKLVSTGSFSTPPAGSGPKTIGGLGMVGPGLNTPPVPKDYKKEGAT